MNPTEGLQILREAVAKYAIAIEKKDFDLKKYCTLPNQILFENQYQFITDKNRFKTFSKSRRAGGTMALAGLFMSLGSTLKHINLAYVTLDRGTAERIIWPSLVKIDQDYQLHCKFNQQKLWIEFPNGSYLYLAGAKDRNEINKLRGKAFYLVGIDECQSFRDSLMKELINDVLEASLIDYGGSLILVGTPNAACVGYFFEACNNESYTHFHWTMNENPWIPFKSGMSVEDIQKEHLARKKITEDDPSYRREWLGLWIKDENVLIYKYKKDRNDYYQLPQGMDWRYVLGCDIGWHDSDALCIWAFCEDLPFLYLAHSESGSHEDITGFAERVKSLEKRFGLFTKRVIDTGGLGKKITEELKARHGLYFEPADKTQKQAYIKLMNADLIQGLIKVVPTLPVVEEWKILQWNTDTEPPKEDERFSNDLSDAALYGWREAKHFTYQQEKPKLQVGSRPWEKELWEDLAVQDKKNQESEWWEKL